MRLCVMGSYIRASTPGLSAAGAAHRPGPRRDVPAGRDEASAEAAVTALYQAHALGLIRLAHIMLGSRSGAEDVVQEAFCGLCRHWGHLSDGEKALLIRAVFRDARGTGPADSHQGQPACPRRTG